MPQGLDSQESSEKTLLVVGVATIVLIVGLLALIFRSVDLPAADRRGGPGLHDRHRRDRLGQRSRQPQADSWVEQILIVVLYGVGTDYILFFLFRHRARMRRGATVRDSVVHSLDRAGEAIASAGGAVIVAFLALILSSLSIFRAIGPALTTLVSGGVLTVLAVFALGSNPSFDFNSSLPEGVESTEAMETFQETFSAGAAEPVPVVVDADGADVGPKDLEAFRSALGDAKGVDQVTGPLKAKSGNAHQFSLTLADDPVSDAAQDHVEGPIRDAAHDAAPEGTEAFVGGTPGIFADMSKAMARDYRVVFPVAAVVIMLILALLLRSLVAPWFLMAAVGLGFAATLGLTVIAFQHIGGESGLIFMLPIYIYLFATALGTDYNILKIARLREEAREGRDPHDAAAQAVTHAGPTIAAAGIILAGTFASSCSAENADRVDGLRARRGQPDRLVRDVDVLHPGPDLAAGPRGLVARSPRRGPRAPRRHRRRARRGR